MYYVYVDDLVEYAQHSETVTGIQRVVVEMIKGMRSRFGGENVRLIANRHSAKFCVYSSELFTPDWTYHQEQFCRFFSVPSLAGQEFLIPIEEILAHKYSGLRYKFHKMRLKFRNLCTGGATFRKFGATSKSAPPADCPNTLKARRFDLKFTRSDIVYVPGEFWNRPIERLCESFKDERTSPKLVLYLHDLIPIAAPEYTGPQLEKIYQHKLGVLLHHTIGVIANSQHTASDLRKYIETCPYISNDMQIIVVPLAHEFIGDVDKLSFYERRSLSFITRLPYVLVVGTANARKNAWATAYVWNMIRTTVGASAPRIIFVDHDVFLNEKFRSFMNVTGNIFGLAEIVRAPTDAQLAYLYKQCMFTIYPSLYEGWGLPVGESIWMEKMVISANTTSLPEVGGDFIDYFDHNDLGSFYNTCLKLVTDDAYRASRTANLKHKPLRRWATVISETIDAIEGIRSSTH